MELYASELTSLVKVRGFLLNALHNLLYYYAIFNLIIIRRGKKS